MGIRLYPSTRDRVRVVLACDETVSEANAEDALAHYLRTGDASAVIVPPGAVHAVLAPLAPDDGLIITQHAGDLSHEAREAGKAAMASGAGGDLGVAVSSELAHWRVRQQLWTVALSLKECDALPGVRPMREGCREVFPVADLMRLPIEARAELAEHVERISRLSPEGKASSGSPSGAATSG